MRNDIDIRLANLAFHVCDGFNEMNAPEHLLIALRAIGATFLSHDTDTDYLLQRISNANNSVQFTQPDLDEDDIMILNLRNGSPSPYGKTARFNADIATQSLWVSQGSSYIVQGDAGVDRTFTGLLRLGERLFPHLIPAYGLIDDIGDPAITSDDIKNIDLKSIGWANFFGPSFVERLGHRFFHEAPAWQVIDLPNGGILVVATESFVAWRYDPYFGSSWPYDWDARCEHPLARYFQRHFPELVIYRGNLDDDR